MGFRQAPAPTFVAFATLPLLASACNHHVYSPPARFLPLESTATLAPGQTGVELEGGAHGALFGPNGESGALRVRYGLDERTDMATEVSLLHVDGSSVAGTFPFASALRVGVKRKVDARFFALVAGLGGGASAGGGFVSPDVGAVVAWENRYLVPFASLRGAASVPFARRKVDTGIAGSDRIGAYVYEPPLTWIAGGVVGGRLPIAWQCEGKPCRPSASLFGGVGWSYLVTAHDAVGVTSFGGGGEFVF